MAEPCWRRPSVPRISQSDWLALTDVGLCGLKFCSSCRKNTSPQLTTSADGLRSIFLLDYSTIYFLSLLYGFFQQTQQYSEFIEGKFHFATMLLKNLRLVIMKKNTQIQSFCGRLGATPLEYFLALMIPVTLPLSSLLLLFYFLMGHIAFLA